MPIEEKEKPKSISEIWPGQAVILPCRADSKPSEAVTVLALCVALASAIFLVLAGPNCHECRLAENVQLLPGLKWWGVCAYCSALLCRLRFGQSQWNSAAIMFLLGTHLCLSGCLLYFQIACLPCILCSISIFIAALATMETRMVSRQFAVIVVSTGILAFAAAYALSGTIAKISTENKVKTSIDYAHLSSVPGSNLTLYVFTREGCRHCGDFEQMDLEAIKAAFGDRVTISVHQAPANLPIVPVSVLIGQRKELIVGRPKKTSQLLLQVESCLQQK